MRSSLNGENFEVKLKEKESFNKWVYEKVPTKYGELEIIRDGTIGLFDNRIWWDYYIDGQYTGTINVNMGGLSMDLLQELKIKTALTPRYVVNYSLTSKGSNKQLTFFT